MYRLLTYTEVDTAIQTRMSNQAPDQTTRLDYINNFMKELTAKYNLEVARRTVVVSMTPDGTPVNIDSLITDGDVNKIEAIREVEDNEPTDEYIEVEHSKFNSDYNAGRRLNNFSFFTSNGDRWLKLNSSVHSDNEEVDFEISYFTSNLGYDTAEEEYLPEITTSGNCSLLLPYNFKKLAVEGICSYLFLISLGKDGETPSAIAENKYKAQLNDLGLTGEAKKIKTEVRKVKLYPR